MEDGLPSGRQGLMSGEGRLLGGDGVSLMGLGISRAVRICGREDGGEPAGRGGVHGEIGEGEKCAIGTTVGPSSG